MGKKFYDLSQPVFHNCPGWPTYRMTGVTYEANYTNDLFNAERLDLNVHTGTHVDAPFHFFPDGKTVDQIPLERWQGEAVLADLRGRVGKCHGIRPEDLEEYEDLIVPETIVLLNTGWGPKRDGWNLDYGHDWPYVSAELAQFLADRKVRGVGIDCLSIGGWYEGTGRPCHEILLSKEIWALEELLFPDELMAHRTCYMSAYPLKLAGFSGSMVRAVAIVEE